MGGRDARPPSSRFLPDPPRGELSAEQAQEGNPLTHSQIINTSSPSGLTVTWVGKADLGRARAPVCDQRHADVVEANGKTDEDASCCSLPVRCWGGRSGAEDHGRGRVGRISLRTESSRLRSRDTENGGKALVVLLAQQRSRRARLVPVRQFGGIRGK